MGGPLIHLAWREGIGRGHSPPRPSSLYHVTAHPSAASVPITVSLYSGMLLYGFNVPVRVILGLSRDALYWKMKMRVTVTLTNMLFMSLTELKDSDQFPHADNKYDVCLFMWKTVY